MYGFGFKDDRVNFCGGAIAWVRVVGILGLGLDKSLIYFVIYV